MQPAQSTTARVRVCALLSVAVWTMLSCQLIVDTSEMNDGECREGYKACPVNGEPTCVPKINPRYGCGEASCQPCEIQGGADFHATAICTPSLTCTVGACDRGYGDCDLNPDDCETNILVTKVHCGECDRRCPEPVANGSVACVNGACTLRGGCETGYADCDGDLTTGCECDLRSGSSPAGACGCGRCDTRCAATESCSNGTCG